MMETGWISSLAEGWTFLAGLLGFIIALLTTAHILLTKRNVQARAGWVGLIWLVPFVGTLLYLLLGVNRIRRRAVSLHRRASLPAMPVSAPAAAGPGDALPESLHVIHRVVNQITRRPLLAGNRVEVLESGEDTFEAMLGAIASAQHSVNLCSYIFDHDAVGQRFVTALAAAVKRGVEVRVLVDAVGVNYSWFDPVDRPLREAGVRVERFLPPRFLPWRLPYANLRNHRKILVVDGSTGFTGGINIRAGYLARQGRPAIRDLHFRLDGPVVAQLQRSFQEDWLFVSGEVMAGPAWFPRLEVAGDTLARGISDGPDEDNDRLAWTYIAGIQAARHSLFVLTPYFLPEPEIVAALNGAAMRGVEVNIVLPEHSNLPPVDWAATGTLEELLAHGCRVWLTPLPFDHGKLFLVDDAWSLIGSGNWDPRSLKLNFEFAVECYDVALGRRLRYLLGERLQSARSLSLQELRRRPLHVRLRDGFAGLFAPYL